MAKVSGPLNSSEARGKVGGLVYNTYRGVSTVRAKHAPAQPRSSLQLQARASAIAVTRAWFACQHKLAWEAYAALHPSADGMGNSIRSSGQNWFVALNTRLTAMQSDLLVDPPPDHTMPAITGIIVSPSPGHITFTCVSPSEFSINIEFWLHGPHSIGAAGSIKLARHINTVGSYVMVGIIDISLSGRYTVFLRPTHSIYGTAGLFQSFDVDVTT
jgi:hypothetical protein